MLRAQQAVADRRRKTVDVSLDDVLTHLGDDVVAAITTNAHRYVDLFSQVIDDLLPEPRTTLTDEDDVADVLAAHRYSQLQQSRKEQAAQGQAPDPHQQLPPQLMRRCVPPPPRPSCRVVTHAPAAPLTASPAPPPPL